MRNCYQTGFGRWKQCDNCGATQHSGYWWIGGYKSTIEPPCESWFGNQEVELWRREAIKIKLGE